MIYLFWWFSKNSFLTSFCLQHPVSVCVSNKNIKPYYFCFCHSMRVLFENCSMKETSFLTNRIQWSSNYYYVLIAIKPAGTGATHGRRYDEQDMKRELSLLSKWGLGIPAREKKGEKSTWCPENWLIENSWNRKMCQILSVTQTFYCWTWNSFF